MIPVACSVAQVRQTDAFLQVDSLVTRSDTIRTSGEMVSMSRDTLFRLNISTKSTGVAMLLSAAFPGAGQVYNESYWKVPIIVGFGVYFVSEWIQNNRRANDYRDRYAQSGDSRDLSVRDFYKKQRDTFTWYFVILYLLNVADAYVDASLYDFTVSDDLSIRIVPGHTVSPQQRACVRMCITF